METEMGDAKRLAMVTILLLALFGCGGRERLGAVVAPADWRSGQVLRGTSVTMPVPQRPARTYRVVQPVPKAKPLPKPEPVLTAAPAAKPVTPKIEQVEVKPTGWVVQLGALDSPAIAKASWKTIVGRHDILQGRPLIETRAVAKGRTVYRIAAGGFASADQARQVCDALRADGGSCFIRG
jgi:cell division septation protein DedD